MLTPRKHTPTLTLETLVHGRFDLDAIPAERGALLQALDFVIANDYPARGEHTGPL